MLAVRLIGVAAAYFFLSRLGMELAAINNKTAIVWPAAGVGFAAVWIWGRPLLAAVFVAEFAASMLINSVMFSVLVSLGNTFSIWLGVAVARRLSGHGELYHTIRNTAAFLAGAGVLSFVAAVIGVSLLLGSGHFSRTPFLIGPTLVGWGWMLSDFTGVLVIAPLCISIGRYESLPRGPSHKWEGPLLLIGVCLTGWVIFGHTFSYFVRDYPLMFAFAPLLLLAAFRLTHLEVFGAVALSSIAAVWGVFSGMGPFSGYDFISSLFILQAFLVIMAGMTLVTHVATAERDETARSLQLIQDMAIYSMTTLAEKRNGETEPHLQRTREYVYLLATKLRKRLRDRSLKGQNPALMRQAAPLHDIGKVGVPDAILQKPGPLTPEEMDEARRHVEYGRVALGGALETLGAGSFMGMAEEIIASHHERWDGQGYPQGLRGEAIPLSGRIMAVADVYDVLISRRVYKEPVSHEEAVQIIAAEKGKQFDPDVVDVFLENEQAIQKIAEKYPDKVQEPAQQTSDG